MPNTFIARQPIYDRRFQVEGYELLFRSGDENQAMVSDADQATSMVLRNLFMEIGLGHLVGDKKAFINVTRNLILSREHLSYPYEKIVFELPKDLEFDDRLIEAVRELRHNGCRFALDNFTYNQRWEPYLDLVDYVKIDIQGADFSAISDQLHLLGGRSARLLAQRVESQEEYAAYRELGFDLFQGYFFCRPEMVRGRKLPASRISTLRLLSQLQEPNIELIDLERIISQDVSLCYRLLRYLNSVQFGLRNKIDNISHAISYLGIDKLRVWSSIILLAKIDEKPVELMKTALVRARFCELLGKQYGAVDPQPYFLAGLFSTLEALLDTPLDEVVGDLPITNTLKVALLGYEGKIGEALQTILAYEQADWSGVSLSPCPDEQVAAAYLKAISWADETIKGLSG